MIEKFLPRGGAQNNFLLHLSTQNIIQKILPSIDLFMIEKIKEIFSGRVLIKLKKGDETCEFPFFELIHNIYESNPKVIQQINLIGGVVRKILIQSKKYLVLALTQAGVKNASSIICDSLLSCQKEISLGDIDLRIHIDPEKTPSEFTLKIIEFIQKKLNVSSFETVRLGAFSKLHKIENKTKIEISKESSSNLSVSKVRKKISMAIASFGCIELKGFNHKPKAEVIIVATLPRKKLFESDALQFNCLTLFQSQTQDFSELSFNSCGNIQSLIDILSNRMRIDDPKSADHGALMAIISGILKGKYLFEKRDVLNLLIDTFNFFLKKKLEKSFNKSDQELIAEEIEKALKNHHEGGSDEVRLFFMYNFTECVGQLFTEEQIAKIWTLIVPQNPKMSGLSLLIDEAARKHHIPFSVIESIIQIAAFFSMGRTSVKEENPSFALKWHIDELCIQVKMGVSADSYLLIPFVSLESLQRLKKFIESKEASSEKGKILLKLFDKISLFNSCESCESSLIKEHERYLINRYKQIAMYSEDLLANKSPFLRYIGYHLTLSLHSYSSRKELLFDCFPKIFIRCGVEERKILLLNAFTAAMSESYFKKNMGVGVNQTFKNLKIFLEQSRVLFSKVKDPLLFGALPLFYKNLAMSFSEVPDVDFSLKLLDSLLFYDLHEALSIFQIMQQKPPKAFEISIEMDTIVKIFSGLLKLEHNKIPPHLFSSMLSIFETFFDRYKNANIKMSSGQFTDACFSFINLLYEDNFFDARKKFLQRVTSDGWISKSDKRTGAFWISMLSTESMKENGGEIEAYDTWKKGEEEKVWIGDKEIEYYFAVLRMTKFFFVKKSERACELLDHIAVQNPNENSIRLKVVDFIEKYFEQFFSLENVKGLDMAFERLQGLYKNFLIPSQHYKYAFLLFSKYYSKKIEDKSFDVWNMLMHLELDSMQIGQMNKLTSDLILQHPNILEKILDHKNFNQYLPNPDKNWNFYIEMPMNWQVFLSHKKIETEISSFSLCIYWSYYLITEAQKLSPHDRYDYLLKHFDKIEKHPEAWIKAVIDVIFSQIKKSGGKCYFYDALFGLFKKFQRGTSFFKQYFEQEEVEKDVIQFTLLSEGKKDSEFLNNFSFCMNCVIDKFLSLDDLRPFDRFIVYHLKELILFSSFAPENVVRLLEKYLFCKTPEENKIYQDHLVCAWGLIDLAATQGMYQSLPGNLEKAEIYLNKVSGQISGKILFELMDDLLKNKKFLTKARDILIQYQYKIREKSDKHLLKCYDLLFENGKKYAEPHFFVPIVNGLSDHSYALFYERKIEDNKTDKAVSFFSSPLTAGFQTVSSFYKKSCSFGEYVLKNFLKHQYAVYLFPLSKHAVTTANHLFVGLFNTAISQTKKNTKHGFHKEIYLIELLRLGLDMGAFIGEKGHQDYYKLVKKFIFYVEAFVKEITLERRGVIFASVYTILCSKEDSVTVFGRSSKNRLLCCPLSQNLKEKRKILMQKWFDIIDKYGRPLEVIEYRKKAKNDGIL